MRPWVAYAGAVVLPLVGWIAAIPAFKSAEKYELNDKARAAEYGSYVPLEDGKVRYELIGRDTAHTVVLVHGFSVPSYVWGPTFRDLSEAGFRVLRFDMFGRGFSDRPRERYDRDFYVHHIGELLDSLRITRPVTLVGLSMGGAVVAAYAAEHPDRVRDVVLIDPTTRPRAIGAMRIPLIGGWIARTFWLPELAQSQIGDFYDTDRFYYWQELYEEQMMFKGFGRALLSTMRHFSSKDPTPDYDALANLDKPVLLIWGEHDRTVPVQEAGPLRQRLGAELFIVPNAGHLPHYEQPRIVSPKIVEFLGRKERAQRTQSVVLQGRRRGRR